MEKHKRLSLKSQKSPPNSANLLNQEKFIFDWVLKKDTFKYILENDEVLILINKEMFLKYRKTLTDKKIEIHEKYGNIISWASDEQNMENLLGLPWKEDNINNVFRLKVENISDLNKIKKPMLHFEGQYKYTQSEMNWHIIIIDEYNK